MGTDGRRGLPILDGADEPETNGLDYELVARQLLRAVRGHRSQVAFSRRLGYRSNPVADWEAGRRFPTAAEMFRACGRAGIDLHLIARRFDPGSASAVHLSGDAAVAEWLSAQRGTATVQEVADRCGRSRYAVGRWLSGATRPRAPDFLRLVDALTGRSAELVAALVDIRDVPAAAAVHDRLAALKRLTVERPWADGVRLLLASRDYQRLPAHRPGWIAARLGLEPTEEARTIELLEQAGLVRWDGVRYRAEPTPSPSSDLRAGPRVRAHLSELSRARSAHPGPHDRFDGLVFVADEQALVRLRTMVAEVIEEARGLRTTEQTGHVGVLQVSLVDLTALPSA